jgi:uncharacterized protein (TIGR02118 family)
MAKVTLVLYKRPNVGWEEFRSYWTENHAELMASLPGARKFVRDPQPLAPARGGPPSDHVAELWFDSAEALRRAIESREGQRALADLTQSFDHRKLGMIVIEDLHASA